MIDFKADEGSKIISQSPEERLAYFKTAVEHSSDAISMSTPEGKHWYQNNAFDQLFGQIGEDPPASLYVDERVGREVFRTIMAGGQWHGEVEMYGRNANVLSVLLRAYAIKDETGKVVSLVGTHTDITDRKQAEETLREREENLRAILAASPNPIVVYDTSGVPQYLNPAFCEIFGWTLEELKGQRIPFVPDDQKESTMQTIRNTYLNGSASKFETRRLTKDGRVLDILISAATIKGADGEPSGMVVNLTDISERKLLQAQYQQAQKMESLGTLAGGIAHDFNNLLMGIQGRASLMAGDLETDHPHYGHIKGIEEYVRSASDLTKQLLGFARGGKYEVKPVDMNELVKVSSEMFGRTRKEVLIHTHFQSGPLAVEVDRRQIEQVLLNLYVNAWQAMPDGGSLYIATKQISLDTAYCKPHQVEPGPFVQVSITDTGIGMDAATRNRIFDPFFTTKEKTRGTGLGLASAFGIIKNHNGIINVYSEKGHGSTFNIFLPASEKQVTREMIVAEKLLSGKETVLLIDDEQLILDVGRALLEKLNYTVITAGSGQEAIELLTQNKDGIDMVILDLIMPGMDGSKTFDQIKAIVPDLAVLLSSGYALNGQADKVLKKGCSGFIQKPFTIQELSSKLRSILDNKK